MPLSGCGAAPSPTPVVTPAKQPATVQGRLRTCLVRLKTTPTDTGAFRCALTAARRLGQGARLAQAMEKLRQQHTQSSAVWAFTGEALRLTDEKAGAALLEQCAEQFPDEAPCFVSQARHAAARGDEATALITLARARDLDPKHIGALSLAARWRTEAGQFSEAAPLLDSLLHAAPQAYESFMAQGLMALRTGQPAAAMSLSLKAVSLHPDAAAPHFLMARAFLELNDRNQARNALESVLVRHPGHHRARAVLGHILVSLGEGARATAHFTALVEAEPHDRDHQLALGRALLLSDDGRSALVWADRVLKKDPLSHEALALKFQALVTLNRLDEALTLRPALYEDERRQGESRLLVARALASAGSESWAEVEYGALVDKHPDLLSAWRSYGRWRYSQRRYLQAAAIFRRGIDHHPKAAILYFDLGDALEEAGRRGDARAMMSQATKLDPTDPDYADELARMEFLDGEIELALGRWRQLVTRFPEHGRPRLRLAHGLLSVDRFQEAAQLLSGLVVQRPADARLHMHLGQALYGAGDSLRAADALERARALGAPLPELMPVLGAVYADLNRSGEAIAAYQHAVRLAPTDESLRFDFAHLLQRQGQLEAAADQLRALLVRNPDHLAARQILDAMMRRDPALEGPHAVKEPGLMAAQVDPELQALAARAPSVDEAPGAVVLRDERKVKVDGGRVMQITHVRSVLVRHRSAVESHQATLIPFNVNAPPQIVQARTLTPDGAVVPVAPQMISTVNPFADTALYGEGRRLRMEFPAVEPGSIVDYTVVVGRPRSVDLGAWWDSYVLGNAEPTVRVRYTLDLPAETQYTAHAPALPAPKEQVTGGRREVIWEAHDLSGYMPRRKPSDPPVPAVHISSLEDWAAVDSWYHDLFSPSTAVDAQLKALTAKITANATDREAKIAAVYAYVESKIQYLGLEIGVGAYKPRPAVSTLARASGDCKDMTALMVAMLDTLGIKALPALVRPRDSGFVQKDHPSPAQFSHVLLYVPAQTPEQHDLWLDATSGMGTLTAVPEMLRGRLAFVVDGDGGALKHVPESDPGAHTLVEEVQMVLTPTGGGTLEARTALTGDLAGKARQHLGRLAPVARHTHLRSPGFVLGGAMSPDSITLEGLDFPEAPVTISTRHEDLDLVGVQLDGSLFYTLDVDLLEGAPLKAMTVSPQQLPARTLQRTIVLDAPEGYRFQWKPLSISLNEAGAHISIREQREGSQTRIEITLEVSDGRYSPRGIMALKGSLRRLQGALPSRLEIKPGGDFDQIAFLKLITEERPEDRRLGRMLARALIGGGEYDQAVAVLERYPDQGRSLEDLTLLSAALIEAERVPEAEQVFASLGARADAPPDVHLALASLLVAKAMHRQAISVLRGGLDHHPKHQGLGDRLVSALFHTGDLEGALVEARRQQTLRPRDPKAQRQLGDVALAMSQTQEAEQAYRAALAFGGENADVLNNLAWLLRDSPTQRGEAIGFALRATQLAPESHAAWDTLAELWFLDGRPQAAVAAIDRALALNPAQEIRYKARRRKYVAARKRAQR